VKNHIGKMVACGVKSMELEVNKVGDNSDGTVVDEGFPSQFTPVIRGKRVKDCLVIAKLGVSKNELSITCHKIIGKGVPINSH